MPNDNWFYQINGKTLGPVVGADLRRLAVSGKLTAATPVQKEGMARWLPASQVKGLLPETAQPKETAETASREWVWIAAVGVPVVLSALLFVAWILFGDSRARTIAALTTEQDDLIARIAALQDNVAAEAETSDALRQEVATLKNDADEATQEVQRLGKMLDRLEDEKQAMASTTDTTTAQNREDVSRLKQELELLRQASATARPTGEDEFATELLGPQDLQEPWALVDPTMVFSGRTLRNATRKAYRRVLQGDQDKGFVLLLECEDAEKADLAYAILSTSFVFRSDNKVSGVGDDCEAVGGVGLYGLLFKRGPAVVYIQVNQDRPEVISDTDPFLGLARGIDGRLKSMAGKPAKARAKPWLGVALKQPTESEKRLVVDTVADGSPAAVAGVEPGDVIVSIGGTPIRDLEAAAAAVDAVRIGEPVSVTVERESVSRTLTALRGKQ